MATPEEWARFLRPLLASVRNPPTPDDFRARTAAIAMALHDVPGAWLALDWRQREAMRRFAFWPAPADLAEWLTPDLAAARDTRARTAEVAAIAAPPPLATRTAEEIEAVRAKVAALKAERSASAPTPQRIEARPAHLNNAQLLATIEREIEGGGDNVALKARAKALRAQMGAMA